MGWVFFIGKKRHLAPAAKTKVRPDRRWLARYKMSARVRAAAILLREKVSMVVKKPMPYEVCLVVEKDLKAIGAKTYQLVRSRLVRWEGNGSISRKAR